MGEENCGPCSNITSSPRGRAEARHSQRTERRRELPCRRLVHVLRTGRDLNRSLDDWVASRERVAARNGFFETRIGDEHENHFYNRTVLARFDLCDVRAKRVPSLYSHAAAYGRCSAVLRGPLRVPVLRGDFSVADNARGPVACESGKNCATPKTSSPACWPGVAIISVLVPAVWVGSRRGFSSVVISSAY